jgi:ABC-type uncharacterized transport system permease subunit
MLLTWIEFASLVVLLNRFEGIAGWHVPEVALLYGFSSYPAALFLLGRQDPHGLPSALAWFAPLAAVLFFGSGYLFWRIGVSKSTSTGT